MTGKFLSRVEILSGFIAPAARYQGRVMQGETRLRGAAGHRSQLLQAFLSVGILICRC